MQWLFQDPSIFEVVVNEPVIKLSTDTADLLGNLVVRSSKENELFSAYITFLNARKKDSEVLNEQGNKGRTRWQKARSRRN